MTYREKIAELRPDCIDESCIGGVQSCPGHYFDGARTLSLHRCRINEHTCRTCWDTEITETTEKEPTSFQEDMMAVLGDMTKAQAEFAIEYLWNKHFKEEQV